MGIAQPRNASASAPALAAADVGMLYHQWKEAERTLRRQFEQHLGASPKQVEQTRRLLLAKRLLTETDGLSQPAFTIAGSCKNVSVFIST